jgi:hypothetical protein
VILSYLRTLLSVVLVFGLVVLLGFVLQGFAALMPWSLLVLFLLIAANPVRLRIARWRDLRRKGYFGGRRVRKTWLYEELNGSELRSFSLPMEFTEPGHTVLIVPDKNAWRLAVPSWARERRTEIVIRIAERLAEADLHWDGA